ncbi:MAG: helix-turn-helix transcriptional regulator [Hyphomonadaceae bacterium]|nr:helix-turn-helix transcriptional regulator [Hyphomonadaceae bacterium]
MLEPIQVKLARVALGLGVRELAEAAAIAPSTITRFESGKGGMQARTLDKIQRVLERGGVVFIDADGNGGVGVRLKR